jgi:phage-related minor tail protein
MGWLGLLLKGKKVAGAIKSVKPNVPKTDIQKATSTLKVEGHKMKASMAKIKSDVFHGTQKIVKSLDKMKTPKKTKHYYAPKDF